MPVAVQPGGPRGPLVAVVLPRLRDWVADQGYSPGSGQQILTVASWLSAWMEDDGAGDGVADGGVLDRFVAGYEVGAPGRAMVLGRVSALRRFLEDPDSPSTCLAAPPASPRVEAELDAWSRWQRDLGGIEALVVGNRRRWVRGLVASLDDGEDVVWAGLDVRRLNDYVAERGRGYSPASRSLLVCALRSMLRWALASGRVPHDLTGGVLRARATRATLPRGLAAEEVRAMIGVANPNKLVDARDRAVVLMLLRLGLRAGEAAGLTLDDIDWATGRITVVGKNRRRLTLPLPVDVGQALVEWLRVRPAAAEDRALFVRARAPIRALSSPGISDIVKHVAERAGLRGVHAHRLRHTAAMNVIACGGTLVEARELLGHASAESAYRYARTDLGSLRALTVPFGRVPR